MVTQLNLLNGFELIHEGEPVALPMTAQRVIAFVALSARPLGRSYVAGTLWPDASEERAAASLRSALWRSHRNGCDPLSTDDGRVSLRPKVKVDFHEALALAHRVIDGRDDSLVGSSQDDYFVGDVLPDWYDDWVVVARERFRQVRLHALESMCRRLIASGKFSAAIESGFAAVAAEPLRESAHEVLINAYLAEGNRVEAIRHYRVYERSMQAELGLDPSPGLRSLALGAHDR